jgi:hypothetical protein
MGFQLSPGVVTQEIDLTTIVPNVATTGGASVGFFKWGPVLERTLVDSEDTLRSIFSDPKDDGLFAPFAYWMTAANFLAYGRNLQVVRVVNNAVSATAVGSGGTNINNRTDYTTEVLSSETGEDAYVANGEFTAKYPGKLGNSLRVELFDSSTTGLKFTLTSTSGTFVPGATVSQVDGGTGMVISWDDATKTLVVTVVSGTWGTGVVSQTTPSAASGTPTGAGTALTSDELFPYWKYASLFDAAPSTSAYCASKNGSNDEIHIVVVDKDGAFTGRVGDVVEKFQALSKGGDCLDYNGVSLYYRDVIANQSSFVWWTAHPSGMSNWGDSVVGTTFSNVTSGLVVSTLSGGSDGTIPTGSTLDGALQGGWALFANPEDSDVQLLVAGPCSVNTARYVINIADTRKDCVAFVSPARADVVGAPGEELDNVIKFRNDLNLSSSYGVLDSGWKYQYDRYSDKYRWVPLNGDIAGLCARTDEIAEPWFSPAGFNRGQIKNVVKLSWNPRLTQRDELYKNGINPVIISPGKGCVLFGDKTLQAKESHFTHIGIRRLFIVLEKAIAIASEWQLFDQNDAFSRAQFVSMVSPFLRDIQSRRGLNAFKVVCDESNNPGYIVDRFEFVGDIYVKAVPSINFIHLNFIATKNSVSFEESIIRR